MKKNKHFSILDKEFSVEGTVSAKGQLIIKGKVKGTLIGDNVIISEEGVVEAEAQTTRMTIGGRFEGFVQASEELIILSTGSCSGKIVCKNFIVEAGGVLNAEVHCMVENAGEESPEVVPLNGKLDEPTYNPA